MRERIYFVIPDNSQQRKKKVLSANVVPTDARGPPRRDGLGAKRAPAVVHNDVNDQLIRLGLSPRLPAAPRYRAVHA